jgi:hypothetical protein
VLSLVVDPIRIPFFALILALERFQSFVLEKRDEQSKRWILQVIGRS